MKVMGLFSGIGGFELAFSRHGMECVGLCEIDPVAKAVLTERFAGIPLFDDVEALTSVHDADVVTAGFPCQDLSQAGAKVGIRGARSSLVDQVFRLIESAERKPEWVVLENVSYMLRLKGGAAMSHIVKRAEELGYNWAYRVLDARCFGLPQRRERVLILLSRSHDPSQVLFPTGLVEPNVDDTVGAVAPESVYGFYWTEGKRGLGWAKNSVPTIKGGSALGIPSPPAIWVPATGEFGTPSIADAERMFGFPAGWTEPAEHVSGRAGARWKLVGNTICVPMVEWLCQMLIEPRGFGARSLPISKTARLPGAAFGLRGQRFSVDVSNWAFEAGAPALETVLRDKLKPLSLRAASGFYKRALESTTIRFADGFLDSMATYIERANSLSHFS
jgi:DNA (cytosine-5)-methyltransferase 1